MIWVVGWSMDPSPICRPRNYADIPRLWYFFKINVSFLIMRVRASYLNPFWRQTSCFLGGFPFWSHERRVHYNNILLDAKCYIISKLICHNLSIRPLQVSVHAMTRALTSCEWQGFVFTSGSRKQFCWGMPHYNVLFSVLCWDGRM